MKLLPVMLLLLVALSAADYYPSRFEDGYTFSVTDTAIYETPDTTGAVVLEIPPGELLEVIGFTGETLRADSCDWGWYEASYRLGTWEFPGYVLDRDLAYAHLSLGSGEVDTLFFYRLTGFDPEAHNFTGQAGVITNGEILASIDYPPCWTPWGRLFDYDIYAALADPAGLDDIGDLVVLSFGMPACGYENRDDLLAWTVDGRLIPGPRASWISEAGVFHYWTEVYLPSDSGGVENQVIHRSFGEEYYEETESYELVDEWTKVFLWTGDSFEELEE